MKKNIIIYLLGLLSFTACVDLDIAPKGLITDNDLLTSASGMEVYMARMYSIMPLEEFKYLGEWGFRQNSWLGAMGVEGTGEALNREGYCRPFYREDDVYWNGGHDAVRPFKLLREANYLIENLPTYKGSFAEPTYNHYLGEAYYIRAFVFYTMAKRFGGIPLVTKVIQYPDEKDVLEVPRASEEETWDQVLADFDMAISLLLPDAPKDGYSSKNIARAYKAEAMLYAGSVAKYNENVSGRLTGTGQKTGVRVIGFAADSWKAASARYFKEAYKAAREVMATNKYSLYKKKWAAGDPEAQYQNMVDMFSDTNSPENIYVRKYAFPTLTHGYDAYSSPLIFRSPLSCATCPTLDFVELFDGFPRYPNGTIKVTTGNSNTEGEYLMYDSPMDFFKNAEPRLRAYIIFPGDMFKGREIDIRAGVYTGNTPVKPIFDSYTYNDANIKYQQTDAFNKTLFVTSNSESTETVEVNGKKVRAAGENGPFYSQGESAMAGFLARKWLNTDPSFVINEGRSAQHFVLMRYADVLLNAAEAAVELSLAGEAAPDGSDLLQVATDAVNSIRERAGAALLTQKIASTEEGRNIVRKERRKELAYEHKTKWDIRRWRVQHYEGRDGFWGEERDKDAFSSNNNYRFRGLFPFMAAQTGKFFFDASFQMDPVKTFGYTPVDYYFEIPGGEVTKSAVIDQQPNR
ncbi:RagB/SusD family nutrient uptake outer membrane protein [Bacteroides sp. OttesenSCG-928-J23]|nr:RagB/SusD family nutrient uptake outer membrane protein [Bacteroides sp. OttesenSCG-928-J23]MDL2303911.1 RagB/SusD family nutrient uptake outer membrane protein [Bacteroides sp. OttesenSCG-928-D19]